MFGFSLEDFLDFAAVWRETIARQAINAEQKSGGVRAIHCPSVLLSFTCLSEGGSSG
jgi:hypothetical protein